MRKNSIFWETYLQMSFLISPKTVIVKDCWSSLVFRKTTSFWSWSAMRSKSAARRVEEFRSLLISVAGNLAFGDQGRAARQKLKSENKNFRISLKMVRNWKERRDFMRLGKGNQTKSVDSWPLRICTASSSHKNANTEPQNKYSDRDRIDFTSAAIKTKGAHNSVVKHN